jgi:hypothetical protein
MMLGVESAVPSSQPVAAPASQESAQTTATTDAATEATDTVTETPEPAAAAGKKAFSGIGKKEVVKEAPSYNPNYKFKVLDKEYEIDEFLRPAIKDADTEKKIREIYEKAYGLDSVKADRQTLKSELYETRERMAETEKALETIGSFVREKDYDSFFEALEIPKTEIMQYALQLVQREQMPPEQKAQWEASRQAQQQARYYQAQNEQLIASQQQFAVQQRTFELNQVVGSPDVKGVADAYNQGMGSPTAFQDYVIQIGQAYAARGQDIPAQQAVAEAIKHLRAINPSLGQVAAQSQVVQPSAKPVIPNIQGRGTSAVKSTVKSLDDLRKKAKDLATNEPIY